MTNNYLTCSTPAKHISSERKKLGTTLRLEDLASTKIDSLFRYQVNTTYAFFVIVPFILNLPFFPDVNSATENVLDDCWKNWDVPRSAFVERSRCLLLWMNITFLCQLYDFPILLVLILKNQTKDRVFFFSTTFAFMPIDVIVRNTKRWVLDIIFL